MSDAAELVARLKVAGEDKYNKALKGAGQIIQEVGSHAQQAGQKIMSGLSRAFNAAESAGTTLGRGMTILKAGMVALTAVSVAAGAGFLAYTKSAIEEATHIERLKLTYAALSGSLDMAAQKMKYLQQYSAHAIGHFDDLAQAGTLLEASGLRLERFIPLIDTVAGVFGGAKEQVLELTSAFSRLTSGVFGESMEIFRRFGITASDFMREGLTVGGNGQVAASTEKMLAAVEHIIKRKYGKFGDIMRDSIAVKFSALTDAWRQMLDRFGQGWFPLITKMLNSVTPFLDFLNQSGIMKGVAQGLGNNLDNMLGVGDGKGLQKMLAFVAATVEALPNLLGNVMQFAKGFFAWIGEEIVATYNLIGQGMVSAMNWMKHTIVHSIDAIRGVMATLIEKFGAVGNKFGLGIDTDTSGLRSPINSRSGDYPAWLFQQHQQFTPAHGIGDLLSGGLKGLGDGLGADASGIGKRADSIFKQFLKSQKNVPGSPDPSQYGMFNDAYTPAIMQHLANIDHSTAHMADLKKFALGGGDLAQMGVTPVEMYAGRQHEIKVNAGNKALNEYLQHLIMEAMTQIQRQTPPTVVMRR